MNFRPKKNANPEINLTPLIDVVLQLIIFFMVTTQFVTMPGITINLPAVGPGSQATAQERLEITISSLGDLYVDGQPVPAGGLPNALARSGHDPDNSAVVLSADRAASHGRIVDIMDSLRRQGFKKIVLAAQEDADKEVNK